MKKVVFSLLFVILLAVFFTSCMPSRFGGSDCPSHDKNYFKIRNSR